MQNISKGFHRIKKGEKKSRNSGGRTERHRGLCRERVRPFGVPSLLFPPRRHSLSPPPPSARAATLPPPPRSSGWRQVALQPAAFSPVPVPGPQLGSFRRRKGTRCRRRRRAPPLLSASAHHGYEERGLAAGDRDRAVPLRVPMGEDPRARQAALGQAHR